MFLHIKIKFKLKEKTTTSYCSCNLHAMQDIKYTHDINFYRLLVETAYIL